MKADINDFFIAANRIESISEEAYNRVELLVKGTEAFSRSTYKCVYIIDYYKKNFLYMADNILYWCGMTAEKVKEMGYGLYTTCVPEKEQQMLLEINKAGFNFYNTVPVNERSDYTITYDFHLVNGKRHSLVHHSLTPMVSTGEGRIWLALCTISMSAGNTPGHVILKQSGSRFYNEYSLQEHKWIVKEAVTLSDMEHGILDLSARGYTVSDIADRLCRSVDTIKARKRAMFARLGVRNTAEALSHASNYRLL